MASPTFNSAKIFDSVAADASYFSEGVLDVLDYSVIVQALHFNGENGMRYLPMGKGDRQWVFRGIITAPTLISLQAQIGNIQNAIDNSHGAGNYFTLVTSFGDSYDNAQVVSLAKTPIMKTGDGATSYMTSIVVQGIIQGMIHEGGL